MTDPTEFNGWTNRETWAANLHIDNEQELYEKAREYAKKELKRHEGEEEINPYHLGEILKGWIEDDLLTFKNLQGNFALWLMLTDIGSLYRVNWREIASAHLDVIKEEVSA